MKLTPWAQPGIDPAIADGGTRLTLSYRFRTSEPIDARLPFTSMRDLLAPAETMLIAAAGGITFVLFGIPAGLVSGSVLAVAIAALFGRPMHVPLPLARACFLTIGILLGAIVTPETLHGIATWPLSVALLVVATVV